MSKKIKIVGTIAGAFAAGIVVTILAFRLYVFPGIATDVGMLLTDEAIQIYDIGMSDERYNTHSFSYWFTDETIENVKNYEYKYIRDCHY